MKTLINKAKLAILRDEGFRSHPYDDQTGAELKKGYTIVGVPTFGHGLTYITKEESKTLVGLRLEVMTKKYFPLLPETNNCNEKRLIVIMSMLYQLGFNGYRRFKNMRQAILDENWQKAYDECLDSKAYKHGLPGLKKRFKWYAETLVKG